MARVAFDEAEKYGGQGGAGFFQLKDDGDTAQVRFMYNSIDDIVGDSVHEIGMLDENGNVVMGKNGRPRKKYVACLRNYDDPKDKCPFCKEGMYVAVRLVVPVYNLDTNKVEIWDRGKKMFKKMTRIASKHPNIVSQVFEIEREGAKGDQQTDYYIQAIGEPDDTTLEDLPPLPDIHGNKSNSFIQDKTAEDMEYYLQEGNFPPVDDEDDEDEIPVRHTARRREENTAPRRRTPARRRSGNNEDVY